MRRAGGGAGAAAAEIVPINRMKRAAGKQPMMMAATTPAAKAPRVALASPLAGRRVDAADVAAAAIAADVAADVVDVAGGAGRVSTPPAQPPPPLPRDANGDPHLLQSRAGIDADESFGDQEAALSSYLKLHPVLSLESTSHQTLQLMANLIKDTSIPTKELEIVPKTHDDLFFRPPNQAIKERPCCLGNRCIAVWLARWRYGDDTDLAFICKEFLRPSQLKEFNQKGALPSPHGKCLLCTRYVQTYIYRCARGDPTFRPDSKIPLQAFGNALGVECGEDVPSHASVVNDSEGYRQEALLFVDEAWADTVAAREGMATLLWRPVVKFCSSHYHYVKDPNGTPRILQRNVGAAKESMDPHFGAPARAEDARSSAKDLSSPN